MCTKKLLIASILTLGAGAAIQASPARELPEDIQSFVLAQQEGIRVQGTIARERIQRQMDQAFKATRLAFIEDQMRAIKAQGVVAVADVKQELDLIQLNETLARRTPRPDRRVYPPEPIYLQYDR